jgi:hypothetical protein
VYGGRTIVSLDSTTLSQLDVGDTTTIPVDATGCDRRELVERPGLWLGYYSSGFELSAFQWCGDTTRTIWVEYDRGAQARSSVVWPDHPADTVPQYFVGFKGRLVGPFSYGHFGMSQYRLTVDSVLFAQRPTGRDCGNQPAPASAPSNPRMQPTGRRGAGRRSGGALRERR